MQDQKKVKQKVIPNVESWNPTNNPKQKQKKVFKSHVPHSLDIGPSTLCLTEKLTQAEEAKTFLYMHVYT